MEVCIFDVSFDLVVSHVAVVKLPPYGSFRSIIKKMAISAESCM